jgi:hypothetical protein
VGHIFTIATHSNKEIVRPETVIINLLQNETFNFHFPYLACLLSGAQAQQLKSPNEAFTMDFSLQNDGTYIFEV